MTAHFKHDKPDTRDVLDRTTQGIIGQPLTRPEGLLKVTGAATYAAEYTIADCAKGVIVTAPFACGTVTAIDESSVMTMPGVIAVITDKRLTSRAA